MKYARVIWFLFAAAGTALFLITMGAAVAGEWYGIGEIGATKLHRHKNNGHWYLDHWPNTRSKPYTSIGIGAGYKLSPWVHFEGIYTDLGRWSSWSDLSAVPDAPSTAPPGWDGPTYLTTKMCTAPDSRNGKLCPPTKRYFFKGNQEALVFSALFRTRRGLFGRVGFFYGWEDLDINYEHYSIDLGKYERETEGLVVGFGVIGKRFRLEARHYDGIGGSSVNWNGATSLLFGASF